MFLAVFGTVMQSKYACQRHLILKHAGPATSDWDFDLISTETKDEQTKIPTKSYASYDWWRTNYVKSYILWNVWDL